MPKSRGLWIYLWCIIDGVAYLRRGGPPVSLNDEQVKDIDVLFSNGRAFEKLPNVWNVLLDTTSERKSGILDTRSATKGRDSQIDSSVDEGLPTQLLRG